MSKLVVEIVDASDLMPKDGQGSASPFVEVEFDDQRQRTQTRFKDLNPHWNEKLVFNLGDSDPTSRLANKTIDVTVYDDRRDNQPGKFLGRVKISGAVVPLSESEADAQRYPLDKRGLFSHIKGDISLRIYAAPYDGADFIPPPMAPAEEKVTKEEKQFEPQEFHNQNQNQNSYEEAAMKPKKKEKETRTFHSIGAELPFEAKPPSHLPPNQPEFRSDPMRAPGPPPGASVMQMPMPGPPRQNPEFQLIETSPPLAARRRQSYYYRSSGGDKTSSTYDLVEQMHYLYVSVVKARDLPVMDVSGSLDPYVEVKIGNYKGLTKHLEKNQNPVWKQIFAFSKERLQSNQLEVTVKDKDLITKDDFVGRVLIDLTEVPLRVPPDSPLAPQWYRLDDKRGVKTNRGEVMLAVWMGTQADESFPDAWHSDAHRVSHSNLSNTRSKVYFSPKLYYLRIHVMEAQDLVPSDKGRVPDAIVKIQAGNQMRATRTPQMRSMSPQWGEEIMFIVSEPFEDMVIVSVDDRVGPGKDEILGRVYIPVREIQVRQETGKMPDPRWFNLQRHSMSMEEETEKKKEKFSSKILLRLCIEAGYHVLDESTHFSSDLQPSSKHLRKPSIGLLELGILSARNLMPMKAKDGRMTDPYCVAKYGNKWVRTRTLLDALAPRWNEQYTWEVHDPCTVITIGVFDNGQINDGGDTKDQRIGKVRVRLSTLETDRVYTHYYPLLVLTPGGLKKNGELQLALRYTCTSFVNMMAQYGRPLLPKMHYVQPIPVRHIDLLRHQAMQIVATRLSRSEPPLRREVVEYMLDVDYHMFSLRRSKANFSRIMSLLSSVTLVCKWFNDICTWRNPITTCLVHVLFLILVCYPELILPTIFLYLFVIGMWNYRYRPRHPPHMDARVSQADNTHPDELDEEFDTFPTSRPADIVRMRYDRLRSVGGRVQTVVGDLATQGERIQALLSWRDPRATALFIVLSLIWAVFIYITPFQVIAILLGLFMLRHPRFRSRMPSVPANFFKRLPARSDMLL
ncbi:C2 calcium/lipid-binding plant phosphoribosyltransferase family protein [Raphanus sativus]|uniref:Multiple C2 domain and transmembrane region protein 6 n=1 Tax=Raphanus sativus TaxID=3726 RepID=A0A6J0JDA2_RAPSA|nr:multiple C2 domain and transmembrane region protein 6 [Raphanus sativus]KAJ4916416.1 C2 calcium/lipid-binding plant phosphoribosyltransferase family protein [Raphanus sativus]